ncbi:hypothetical protein SDC9_194939 [bioreactor metagenome]|uniref:DUF2953 domain-containing protein n=1 Tax=bioreactor metagenome TaxID=1076179 RepID=A0A645I7L9_9ZZZZ
MRIKMPHAEMPPPEAKLPKASKENEKKAEEDAEEKQEKRKIDIAYFKNMPKDERKKLISDVIKFIKSVLKTVFPKSFKLLGSFGLSDPALTGEVLGGIYVLKGFTGLDINVSGDFRGENVLNGKIFIEGRITLSALGFYTLRLALTKPVFKIIKIYLKG